MAPGPAVMLASSPKQSIAAELARLQREGGWSTEVKWDGIRAVVRRASDGTVTITNRREADITYRYPDVVADVQARMFTGVVDGEIIVAGPDGRPSFALAHRRDAQARASAAVRLAKVTPATFMPFDVLEAGERDVRALPWRARRGILEDIYGPGVPVASTDAATMWGFVVQHDLEGLIAKRVDSIYVPKRSSSWVKLKKTHRAFVLATGVQPGQGSRGAVGALLMALYGDQGKLVAIGSVGSGLSERAQKQALMRLEAHRAGGGPFPVIEVEYLEVAPSGQLRMPVFKGFRDDIDPAGLTVDALSRS
jgi:bifunctional non-homologous end joining protein LigD